ncbi:hypothetical protein [Arcticibacterium luteifluviistationis]|uniref:Uncharacterized protein n=1 Tax=Arcticibacterium luteifluviistationis TaxID=1784714 RepID=A0A2Z4G9R1_9BACT|nr:hypothetical protein [Arcticibacterium luteifluviistationis]AWV97820.1 hypothetical protein DJ013_06415 [Arcticibacterium luteifluviistationis]
MSIKTMSTKPLGYAELITNSEQIRRKNSFIKFLFVFPAAFIAYIIHGGIGPLLQSWFINLEFLIPMFQTALFLHFLGKANILKGFDRFVSIFNGDAWQKNRVLQYIPVNVANSWIPFFVNLMIFMAMMIGFQIGLSIFSKMGFIQSFLEKWNVLYPNAGSAPIYAFWKNSIIVPIALSFLSVVSNWLFLDKLNEIK